VLLTIDDSYREQKLKGFEQEDEEMQYAILFFEMQKDLNEPIILSAEKWYEIIKSTPNLDVENTGLRVTLQIIEDASTDAELKMIINEFLPKLSFVLIAFSGRSW
jgi:hypothetical protein